MKLYHSLLALLFSSISYCQEYPQMVVEGATWIYQHEYNNINTYNFHVYHINGDTTVNGIEYSKVYLQDFDIDTLGFLSISSTGIKSALMREDTLSKKVYTIILDESILIYGVNDFEEFFGTGEYEDEYLLYDFSLLVGDTLDSPNFNFTIFDIETVEKFNYEVKKFNIDAGNQYFERFGGEFDLFAQLKLFFVQGGAPTLLHYCITDNYECEVFIGTSSIANLTQSEFSVFPNPADQFVAIKVPNEKILSLRLLTAEGRLMFTQNQINANDITVDLSQINYKGIINIVGITENSRFVKRLIKI